MPDPSDAYHHHPELRDRIADPETSFFRDFNAVATFECRPELHWVMELLYTDAERDRLRATALDGHSGDLWVFAYGSLMWDPAIRFAEVRRASVSGYARRFILKDIYGGRGTREAPGLMAALDHGDGCEGLAFRIAASDVEIETEILWRREVIGSGYLPTFLPAVIGDDTVQVLAFVADHSTDSMHPDLSHEEQVEYIAQGAGFMGTSRDYLANIVAQFEVLGIHDEATASLLRDVDARLAGGCRPANIFHDH